MPVIRTIRFGLLLAHLFLEPGGEVKRSSDRLSPLQDAYNKIVVENAAQFWLSDGKWKDLTT
jgi:hypothetical protein